MSKTKQEKERR